VTPRPRGLRSHRPRRLRSVPRIGCAVAATRPQGHARYPPGRLRSARPRRRHGNGHRSRARLGRRLRSRHATRPPRAGRSRLRGPRRRRRPGPSHARSRGCNHAPHPPANRGASPAPSRRPSRALSRGRRRLPARRPPSGPSRGRHLDLRRHKRHRARLQARPGRHPDLRRAPPLARRLRALRARRPRQRPSQVARATARPHADLHADRHAAREAPAPEPEQSRPARSHGPTGRCVGQGGILARSPRAFPAVGRGPCWRESRIAAAPSTDGRIRNGARPSAASAHAAEPTPRISWPSAAARTAASARCPAAARIGAEASVAYGPTGASAHVLIRRALQGSDPCLRSAER
jgi:hypothetical protein